MNHDLFDFSEFPILKTGRLVLREMTQDDAPAVFAIFGDAETCRYFICQNRRPYPSIEETTANVINWSARRFKDRLGLRWALTLCGDNTLIGTAGYNYWDQRNHCGEVGYDLLRTEWGKGLMPEALHAILRFGFTRMALNRVEADVTEGNSASIRVLEKCGFRQDGVLRQKHFCNGQYFDNLLFGLLRRDYEAQFGQEMRI
jgi:ribosomal-protein-alanine N-acetyltransferase